MLLIRRLVGCFGFNGTFREYFRLYRAISRRGRKKRELIYEREKCPNNTIPHLLLIAGGGVTMYVIVEKKEKIALNYLQ